MKAEKYTINHATGQVTVEPAELPDGVDAVFIARSDLERQQMHNTLVHLQNDACVRTWPPSCPKGGDKEPERLYRASLAMLDDAARLRQAGDSKGADVLVAEAGVLRAKSGI